MRDLVPLLLCFVALVGTFALRATVQPFPLVLAEDGPGVAAATFWMGAWRACIVAHMWTIIIANIVIRAASPHEYAITDDVTGSVVGPQEF